MNLYPIKEHIPLYNQLNAQVYVDNTWLIIPDKLKVLITDFLNIKIHYGSAVEMDFYREITLPEFVHRLFEKRPLCFTGSNDVYTLRENCQGIGHWETIGTPYEQEPLVLREYLSYDEIEIAAFLGVSCLTPFINNGSRHNDGRISPKETIEPYGIYIGQVGTRFQKPGRMEYRFMIISKEQNTIENGYGPNNNSINGLLLQAWAKFYEVPYFPTYDEACSDPEKWPCVDPVKLPGTKLNVTVYKQRVRILAEVFLKEANNRALQHSKQAYCYVVGLGLGVWAIDKSLQNNITVEVYLELLRSNAFKGISDLYFGYIAYNGELPESIHDTKIHMGTREPADSLKDRSKILVANWAWDANSFVGNEFWCNCLGASGDPAAASCSFVGFFANPLIHNVFNIHAL